jgi:2-keto-3-deoxy-L-rhamnonate aldolase RhmA
MIERGEHPVGTFVMSVDAAVTAVLASAGFTFVIIDCEHGPNDVQSTLGHIRAAEANGVIPLVRVGENSPRLIQAALDIGAHGLVVPKISTAAEAEAAVRAARYGPGGRGMCAAVEGARWSTDLWDEHTDVSNRNVVVVPLIETTSAIENAGDIAGVEGIDFVLFGAGDLAQDLGLNLFDHEEEILGYFDATRRAVQERGAWFGAAAGRGFMGQDFSTVGGDLLMLKSAAEQRLAQHRAGLSSSPRPDGTASGSSSAGD